MRIQSSDNIANYPASTIRTLMRRGRENGPTTSGNTLSLIADVLNIDLASARVVFQELYEQEYIEPVSVQRWQTIGECQWYTTIKGNALANASARKPISRTTAERIVKEFLDRVQQVNSGEYAYCVKRVILFGSYLSDTPILGDVDFSLELEDRYQDERIREDGHTSRIVAAQEAGRNFRDYLEMLLWPQQEVLLPLKNRSPFVSLHKEEREQVLAKHLPSRIIFDADGSEQNGSETLHKT